LRNNLERLIGRKVVVDNDANAWALGEYWARCGRAAGATFVLLTLGTGVGGGLIVGGKLVHGRSGMAGELGHVTVNPDGPPCDAIARMPRGVRVGPSGLRGLVENRLGLRPGSPLPLQIVDSEKNFSVRGLSAQASPRRPSRARDLRDRRSLPGNRDCVVFSIFFNPELVRDWGWRRRRAALHAQNHDRAG